MRSIVRFNAQRLSNSIKSGGFNIGVDNKSANLTGFFNGITPIIGGYVIYVNKASGGPSIYTPQNDTGLINITKSLGGNVSTVTESLVWINSQSNMTVVNTNYPPIVTEGLVLNLDAGLVSSYPKTGTTWKDLSGNGYNGTLVNGPTYNGENDGTLVFDGTNDYIDTPTSIGGQLLGNVTFSLWAKRNGNSPSGIGGLIGNLWHTTFTGLNIYLRNDNTGITVQTANGTTRTSYVLTSPVSNLNWVNYVLINNGGVVSVYVNGVLLDSRSREISNSSIRQVTIGRWAGSFNSYYLNGEINNALTYNRALTPDEIQQNYLSGLQRFIPTNGLVLSLDAQNTNLYATSPTTANDISGNNNNGTMLNGVQYIGDVGGCWKFDGVNDFINVPNSSSLQVTGNQTLVFWVYPERRDRRQNFYNKAYGGEGTITYETNGSLNYYWGTNGGNGSPYQGVNSGVVMSTLNTWYFIVLVRELSTPSRTVKWYINGVLNQTVSASYTSATAGTSPIIIGDGYTNEFLGKIGMVKQYNIALTQDDITTIYNATKSRYGI